MKKQLQIVKHARIFMLISLAIILVGVGFFAYRWAAYGLKNTLNLKVEFTGGTIMTVDLREEFNESDVADIVESLGISDVTVNKSSASTESKDLTVAQIRFKDTDEDQNVLREKITTTLKNKYKNLANDDNNNIDSQGAVTSREAVQSAIAAVLLSCACILVYVAWRFDSDAKNAQRARWINTLILAAGLIAFYYLRSTFWLVSATTLVSIAAILFTSVKNKMYSGLSAVLALLHDVLIMFSAMIIFNVPLGNAFIAVVLTIIGYSINDTIVIYDRIRENTSKYSAKEINRKEIANTSINEMLGRSIKTAVTTLIMAVGIYVLGVEAVKEFALPMIIGLVAGSYSTIFIASPVWAEWQDRAQAKELAKKAHKIA